MNEPKVNLQEIEKQAGILIIQVLDNQILIDECLKRWPSPDWLRDEALDTALHALYHFQSDTDIRAKDEHYDLMQREELLEIAKKLMENRPLKQEQIAFYQPRFLNPLRWFKNWLRTRIQDAGGIES